MVTGIAQKEEFLEIRSRLRHSAELTGNIINYTISILTLSKNVIKDMKSLVNSDFTAIKWKQQWKKHPNEAQIIFVFSKVWLQLLWIQSNLFTLIA